MTAASIVSTGLRPPPTSNLEEQWTKLAMPALAVPATGASNAGAALLAALASGSFSSSQAPAPAPLAPRTAPPGIPPRPNVAQVPAPGRELAASSAAVADDGVAPVAWDILAALYAHFDDFSRTLAAARARSRGKSTVIHVEEFERALVDTAGPEREHLVVGADAASGASICSSLLSSSVGVAQLLPSGNLNSVGTRVAFPHGIKPWVYVKEPRTAPTQNGNTTGGGSGGGGFGGLPQLGVAQRRGGGGGVAIEWDVPAAGGSSAGFILGAGAQPTRVTELGSAFTDGVFVGEATGAGDDELLGGLDDEEAAIAPHTPTSPVPALLTSAQQFEQERLKQRALYAPAAEPTLMTTSAPDPVPVLRTSPPPLPEPSALLDADNVLLRPWDGGDLGLGVGALAGSAVAGEDSSLLSTVDLMPSLASSFSVGLGFGLGGGLGGGLGRVVGGGSLSGGIFGGEIGNFGRSAASTNPDRRFAAAMPAPATTSAHVETPVLASTPVRSLAPAVPMAALAPSTKLASTLAPSTKLASAPHSNLPVFAPTLEALTVSLPAPLPAAPLPMPSHATTYALVPAPSQMPVPSPSLPATPQLLPAGNSILDILERAKLRSAASGGGVSSGASPAIVAGGSSGARLLQAVADKKAAAASGTRLPACGTPATPSGPSLLETIFGRTPAPPM